MSDVSAVPGRNATVTAAGVLTVVWGCWHVILGVWTVLIAVGWLAKANSEPWWPVLTFFGLLPLIAIVIATGFVLYGLLGLFAGVGVIRRRRWARIVTGVIAGLALFLGVLTIIVPSDQSIGGLDLVTTSIQILYGAFTVLVLATRGAEFSRGVAAPNELLITHPKA